MSVLPPKIKSKFLAADVVCCTYDLFQYVVLKTSYRFLLSALLSVFFSDSLVKIEWDPGGYLNG